MINYNDPNQSWLPNGYDPYKGMNEKQRMMAGCLQGAAFVLILCAGHVRDARFVYDHQVCAGD